MSNYHYLRNTKRAKDSKNVKAMGRRTYGYNFAEDGYRSKVDYKKIDKYLKSRVGYSWNKTYSALCKKYDSRTDIGYYTLEYIKYAVCQKRVPRYWYSFYIDDKGILRHCGVR